MRQRITYIRSHDDAFNLKQLTVSKQSMVINNLVAAKEHRFTIGFSELPHELIDFLEQCHELRIRWVSEKPYSNRTPFISRVAPGLHVFFTPETEGVSDLLCPTLKKVFSEDIKCSTATKTFSNPSLLSTRFASSASSQYHTLLPSLSNLIRYLQPHLQNTAFSDSKTPVASSLSSASYLDIDYDAISHALLITVFWEGGSDKGAWNERIVNAGGERVEVGILNREKADEKEEIGLGGWLTVIGENERANPTLFTFPSRHHPLPATEPSTFYTTLDQPTGLHPTLRLTIPRPKKDHNQKLTSPSPSCALHAYLTLPSSLFLDRHAFTDPLFLSSHKLASLRTVSGATDLEAPEWAVEQWGSASLFELATTSDSDTAIKSKAKVGANGDYEATIPLHTRYLNPSPSSPDSNRTLPYPSLFWACMAAEGAPGSAKMSVNPFDRVNLGYDGLFGDRTVFYHFMPVGAGDAEPRGTVTSKGGAAGGLTVTLAIPTLDLRRAEWVERGTVGAVVLGMVWVLWVLWRPIRSGVKGSGGGGGGGEGTATGQVEGKKRI